jgi:modulator of FtsH protease
MMYPEYAGVTQRDRATLAGQVFGLLGFSMLFTMGGAIIGPRLGPGAFWISLIGSLGCLFALWFLKDKSPLNLGLFYLFSVAEGMLLGLVVEIYLQAGMGSVVVNAAATTAAVVLALGAYAWTTKRDLTGMGGFLFIALLGVIVAGLVNMFLRAPLLSMIISAASAVIFSLFLMVDMQRVRDAQGGTGDAIMLAVAIYLDIFNIFLALLQIFGIFGGRDE